MLVFRCSSTGSPLPLSSNPWVLLVQNMKFSSKATNVLECYREAAQKVRVIYHGHRAERELLNAAQNFDTLLGILEIAPLSV
jgi:hypothetical protein